MRLICVGVHKDVAGLKYEYESAQRRVRVSKNVICQRRV